MGLIGIVEMRRGHSRWKEDNYMWSLVFES